MGQAPGLAVLIRVYEQWRSICMMCFRRLPWVDQHSLYSSRDCFKGIPLHLQTGRRIPLAPDELQPAVEIDQEMGDPASATGTRKDTFPVHRRPFCTHGPRTTQWIWSQWSYEISSYLPRRPSMNSGNFVRKRGKEESPRLLPSHGFHFFLECTQDVKNERPEALAAKLKPWSVSSEDENALYFCTEVLSLGHLRFMTFLNQVLNCSMHNSIVCAGTFAEHSISGRDR